MARELLEANADALDATSRKIRELCEDELKHCADTGKFQSRVASRSGSFLFALLHSLAELIPADTQVIESINSIVKLVGRRCPNISLELLSSRLVTKRFLSQADGTLQTRKKWSVVKGYTEAAVKELNEFTTAGLNILADGFRWSVASAVPLNTTVSSQALLLPITDVERIASVMAGQWATTTTTGAIATATAVVPEVVPATSSSSSSSTSTANTANATCSPSSNCRVPAEALPWAKAYNLAWKRATVPPTKKRMKAMKKEGIVINADILKQMKSSFLVAIFSRSGHDGTTQHQFFLVVERFSHSVQFAQLKQHRDAEHCLRVSWQYKRQSCIESTLLFLSLYRRCTYMQERVKLQYVRVDKHAGALMFGSGVEADFLVSSALDVATLSEEGPPGVTYTYSSSKKRRKTQTKMQGNKKTKSIPKRKPKSRPSKKAKKALQDCSQSDHTDDEGDPNPLDNDDDDDEFCDSDNLDCWEDHGSTDTDSESSSEGESTAPDSQQVQSKSRLDDSDDDTGDLMAAEIRAAQSSKNNNGKKFPTTTEVLAKAATLASDVPQAEREEEALLFLIRCQQDQRIGCGVTPSITATRAGENDTEQVMPQDDCDVTSTATAHEAFVEENNQYFQLMRDVSLNLDTELANAFGTWLIGCHQTLKAMKLFAETKHFEIGTQRSLAFVLMKPMPEAIPGCACVRCKLKEPSSDLCYIHWLNNNDRRGSCRTPNVPGANYILGMYIQNNDRKLRVVRLDVVRLLGWLLDHCALLSVHERD